MEQARKSVARELHRLRGTRLLPPGRARRRAADAKQAPTVADAKRIRRAA